MILTVALGRRHGLSDETEAEIVKSLHALPQLLEQTLELDPAIEDMSKAFAEKRAPNWKGR